MKENYCFETILWAMLQDVICFKFSNRICVKKVLSNLSLPRFESTGNVHVQKKLTNLYINILIIQPLLLVQRICNHSFQSFEKLQKVWILEAKLDFQKIKFDFSNSKLPSILGLTFPVLKLSRKFSNLNFYLKS